MDKTSVAILNFFIRSSTVTATYRIMDADSTSFLPLFAGLVCCPSRPNVVSQLVNQRLMYLQP